ncbi:MAG: MBL fold metallo-hydrolase [Dermatophilaceae bacterium]
MSDHSRHEQPAERSAPNALPPGADPAAPVATRHSGRRAVLRAGAVSTIAGLAAASWSPATHAAASTDRLPVPPNARGPQIPAEGYVLEEIGDRVFWLADGATQMIFLVSGDGVIAVDAPPTLGNNILRAIRRVTTAEVTQVVYSHSHADHIGAASLYPDRAQRISHATTAALLRAAGDPDRPLPTRTFRRSTRVHAGDQVLDLAFHGPNHSPDNIFIHAPRHRVLMVVDVVYPGWVPFRDLAVSEDIPGWVRAHDQILDYPFETFVGGHVTRYGSRDDVLRQRDYIRHLEDEARAAIEEVDFRAIAQEYGTDGNIWAVSDAYFDALATRAGTASARRWGAELGAADIFGADNAFAMAESLRIDRGILGPFGIRP